MLNFIQPVIGLTGMSGAGKTSACDIFAESGFAIMNCDKLAKDVVRKDSQCIAELRSVFPEIVEADGTLNRKKTAQLIFKSAKANETYQQIIFPYIRYLLFLSILQAQSAADFILIDAPTLFECQLHLACDDVVSIVTDREIAMERIIARDGLSAEAAAARLSSQKSIAFYQEHSSYIIQNRGDFPSFHQEIKRVIHMLRSKHEKNKEK